jgi:hypothetical protein
MFAAAFFMPLKEFSQELKPKEPVNYKVTIAEDRSIAIEFDTQQPVGNILILVVDSAGHTIFMDSQNNFKGTYKCSIDMKRYANGDYMVKIKSDGDVVDKTLSFK